MENLKNKIQSLINLYKSNKFYEAESLCQKLIKKNSNVVILYNILGLIYTAQKRIEDAITCYEKGLNIDPNFAMIYNNLGSLYKLKENNHKAEDFYKKAINLDKRIPEPHNNLGNLYRSQNKYNEAIESYKNGININNKFFPCYYNLGIAFKTVGNFKKAIKYLKSAIKLNPNYYPAQRNLGQMIKYSKNDKNFVELKKIYNNINDDNLQKKELAFALGKACEDFGDFNESFKFYSHGNYLHRKSIDFSITKERDEFTKIKKTFNKELFYKFDKAGNMDARTIFVLGMPRSGTTLVEQILSSHPDVFGADELNLIPNLMKKLFKKEDSFLSFDGILNTDLKEIGKEYIDNIENISNNSKRVTDKLTVNFKWIGFIKLILPNSKIIHCTRNSKDNSFSIFKNFFTSNQLKFAYDLNEISNYYNLYSDLMDHWNNVLPNFVLNINYENIIQNPKKEIRQLLKGTKLSWNDNCLKFHNNKRPIKTASDVQARKKIYKSSMNSWKKYKKFLRGSFKKI